MDIPALPGANTFLQSVKRSDTSRGFRVETSGLRPTWMADGLRASGTGAAVSLTDSRALVAKAVTAARSVLSGLDELQAMAAAAAKQGFLDGVPDLSRLTLQADLQMRIRRMDQAVDEATVGGRNLVSGAQGNVRLATTGLGGTVEVAAQGMNSASLGVAGLDLTTDLGVTQANRAIALARADATMKLERLSGLARTFDLQASFVDDVTATVDSRVVPASGYGRSGASSDTVRRGTVVDLRV